VYLLIVSVMRKGKEIIHSLSEYFVAFVDELAYLFCLGYFRKNILVLRVTKVDRNVNLLLLY